MKEKLTSLWQKLRNEKRTIWFEYGILALMILLPLLLPGYILTLDLVFTPHFAWPTELTNVYPLQALLWLFHLILPGDVIEKIILFVILVFSGVGMHLLVRSITTKGTFDPDTWRFALYFAGILYMINPFTYSRFMAGQWMVLLGYALLPFFVRALLRFLALPSRKTVLSAVMWAFVIITTSIHHIGILLLISIVVPVWATIMNYWRDRRHIKRFVKWSGIGLGGLAVLSSFWLIPALLGKGSVGMAIQSFDQTHFSAFQTSGGGLRALGDVVRLQGFWAEDRQLYQLPQDLTPAWGLVFLLIWAVIIIGAAKAWRSHRLMVGISVTCILLGIILSATPLLAWWSQFLPFLSGYREPQKFVNLIVLGYCLLGAFGVAVVIEKATKRFNEAGGQAAILGCLLLPLIATSTMLWGFGGQLSPRSYPDGWYEMNQKVKDLPGEKRVLFLPWHQYAPYTFSGRLIASPAEKFFTVPIISSDQPEFKSITPNTPNEEKQAITEALKHPQTLPKTLQQYGITHVLLAKEKDSGDYKYLDENTNFQLETENTDMKLYRLEG